MIGQAVIIKPYDSKLPLLFRQEKRRLKKLLPAAGIYHVGSSAVPGLGGKNVVDILVIMPTREEAIASIALLRRAGYEYRPAGGGPERLFFRRGPRSRRFHLHLTWRGTSEPRQKLFFRNYLRGHPKVAARYYRLKVLAARKAGADRKRYLELKSCFIEKTNRRA